MGFWDTFWATMCGALGGAVVGAAAAWLFSLDLRRRDRIDREGERQADRADRQQEREDARADRAQEREELARLQQRVELRWRVRPILREVAEKLQNLALADISDDADEAAELWMALSAQLWELGDELEGDEYDLVAAIQRFVHWPTPEADPLDVWVKLEMYVTGKITASEVAAVAKKNSISDEGFHDALRAAVESWRLRRDCPWPLARHRDAAVHPHDAV